MLEMTEKLKRALEIVPVEWDGEHRLVFGGIVWHRLAYRYETTLTAENSITKHEAECLIKEALREWLKERLYCFYIMQRCPNDWIIIRVSTAECGSERAIGHGATPLDALVAAVLAVAEKETEHA